MAESDSTDYAAAYNYGTWISEKDKTLLNARTQGINWAQIQRRENLEVAQSDPKSSKMTVPPSSSRRRLDPTASPEVDPRRSLLVTQRWEQLIDPSCEVITRFCISRYDPYHEQTWVEFPRVLLSTRMDGSYIYESRLLELGMEFMPISKNLPGATPSGTLEPAGLVAAHLQRGTENREQPFLVTFLAIRGSPTPGGVDFIVGRLDLEAAYGGCWKPEWPVDAYALHATGHGFDYLSFNQPGLFLRTTPGSGLDSLAPASLKSNMYPDQPYHAEPSHTLAAKQHSPDTSRGGEPENDRRQQPRSPFRHDSLLAKTDKDDPSSAISIAPEKLAFIDSHTVDESHNTDSGYGSAGRQLCQETPNVAHVGINQGLGSMTKVETADSVYSYASSIGMADPDTYKSELVDDIVDKMRQFRSEPEALEAVFDALPRLLKSFALRLGQRGSSKAQKEVMYFVHKHWKNLSERFRDSILASPEDDSARKRETTPVDSGLVSSRLHAWLGKVKQDETDQEPDCCQGPDEETDLPDLPDTHEYRNVVFNSAAYKSLLSNLAREFQLTPVSEAGSMKTIRDGILAVLPVQRRISRHRESETFTMKLRTKWDPVRFIRDQFRVDSSEEKLDVLGRAITLTGSMGNAQALPSSEYLSQTWPTVGPAVLTSIIQALQSERQATVILPDRSEIEASMNAPGEFQIMARGTTDFIAESGEIFAWITSALRSSSNEDAMELCTPYLKVACRLPDDTGAYGCEIGFKLQADTQANDRSSGRCWHGLFRNPVVVTGFPIPRRPRRQHAEYGKENTGLEIPLLMAARLTDASRLHDFHGRFFLKGFSAMLVAMGVIGDLVLWHLYYNPTGGHISYIDINDAPYMYTGGISTNLLRSSRHVIGWSSDVLCMFGDSSANYNILGSNLPPPPARDFCLEKLSLSVGQIVTGSMQFSMAKKDVPARITKKGYHRKLDWIQRRYFVLWDEEDKRAWLTTGTGALGHLLRTSLQESAKDNPDFLLNPNTVEEALKRFRNTSARDILRNKVNRKLKLYENENESTKVTRLPDGTKEIIEVIDITYERVEDLVEDLFDILDKLIANEEEGKASQKGISVKPSRLVRSHLQGWDFRDIATQSDPFRLREMKLSDSARTWAEFAKSIGAVILFGRGFGELIKPAAGTLTQPLMTPSTSTQQAWRTMPTGYGLLGACIADLREIINNRGSWDTEPLTISEGILWDNPSKHDIFVPNGSIGAAWNPIQELQPETNPMALPFLRKPKGLKVDIASDEHMHGAVIFGRAKLLKSTLPEITGDPVSAVVADREESDSGSDPADAESPSVPPQPTTADGATSSIDTVTDSTSSTGSRSTQPSLSAFSGLFTSETSGRSTSESQPSLVDSPSSSPPCSVTGSHVNPGSSKLVIRAGPDGPITTSRKRPAPTQSNDQEEEEEQGGQILKRPKKVNLGVSGFRRILRGAAGRQN